MNKKIINIYLIFFIISFFGMSICGISQTLTLPEISDYVQAFKEDSRGPYKAIRWFCPDGSIVHPQKRCKEPGGVQHGLPKDIVVKIARQHHVFLGQILAGTPHEDFLDKANRNSRMKQYQMERFLHAADDGWIMRRARYYRGAIQAEDEDAWGQAFLENLAGNDTLLSSQYYLIRQISKDLPHGSNSDRWQNIRALSKTIGDTLADFMDLRVKLHSQPDEGDILRVQDFYEQFGDSLEPEVDEMITELLDDLKIAYRPFDINILNDYIALLPEDSPISRQMAGLVKKYGAAEGDVTEPASIQCREFSNLMFTIRFHLTDIDSADNRLSFIDLSNELENLVFRSANLWQPTTLGGFLEKAYTLALAAAGGGYLEIWEWDAVAAYLETDGLVSSVPLAAFAEKAEYARRTLEWGTGMVRSTYHQTVELYGHFEPLAHGFIDDRIRASVLLPLGETASRLNELSARNAGISNRLIGVKNPGQTQGVNPGFAAGELVVHNGSPEDIDFSAKKIYILQRAPSDIKPVAGIATVTEGNLVSHVQLLARNLGIPNAIISNQNINDLLPYSGLTVFYAVSPRGSVILKPVAEMTREERALIAKKKRPTEKVAVQLDQINLAQKEMLDLRALRAADSGHLVGPKAANLGELKSLFPDKVVEGFAIPFGIFRDHMDQMIPGENISYWAFLQKTFKDAELAWAMGKSSSEIEAATLERLAILREKIAQIPFLPGFEEKLRQAFLNNFDSPLGQKAVFIRSDTNMEDLEEFTGAGLNLTVFNVADSAKILQGIRDVWASPYTERSYRWRQQYLSNPENVFPSILVMPTVNVDKSGVMITAGVSNASENDITVAFSRGPGGAVDGQAAESYLIQENGQRRLLSPAREETYNVLPDSGGAFKGVAHFDNPLLSATNLDDLQAVAREIEARLEASQDFQSEGPLDIELGFLNDKIWLFQVRPFVENKRAQSSNYLNSLDPVVSANKMIRLDQQIMEIE